MKGGFYFHPTDEDLSAGTPEQKKPLDIVLPVYTNSENAIGPRSFLPTDSGTAWLSWMPKSEIGFQARRNGFSRAIISRAAKASSELTPLQDPSICPGQGVKLCFFYTECASRSNSFAHFAATGSSSLLSYLLLIFLPLNLPVRSDSGQHSVLPFTFAPNPDSFRSSLTD
ncbi:MAG: hypothetical protein ABSC77_14960 [Terracidiphilus sp.]